MKACAVALATTLLMPMLALGDAIVVPTERVVNGVSIRASATTDSAKVGSLLPGESATFLGEVPNWYRIDHPAHGSGFVSKSWTRIETDAADVSEDRFDLYVVDVGTGLAIFVRGKDFSLVYDAGSNDDLTGNRFLDILDEVAADTTAIDHLIISHPHRDHISMLPDLLEAMQVSDIWDSGVFYGTCIYQQVVERIADEGARYHTAVHEGGQHAIETECSDTRSTVNMSFASRMSTGQIHLGSSASMTFLHVDGSPRSDLNENSLVVMLELGGVRALLTGDAGGGERLDPGAPADDGSVERALIDCCSDALSADVLIIGHHGSKTSSRQEFIAQVEAREFVVSSGPKAYSGTILPDHEVIEMLGAQPGARLWRTDEDDPACLTDPDKVGADNDGKAGGCTNIHIQIPGSNASYSIDVL